uniref:Uncharacterized protein n=1 Tax=Romanomermis culicivorax TaxID=13658 RepID=A0A915L1Z5_ROMCU
MQIDFMFDGETVPGAIQEHIILVLIPNGLDNFEASDVLTMRWYITLVVFLQLDFALLTPTATCRWYAQATQDWAIRTSFDPKRLTRLRPNYPHKLYGPKLTGPQILFEFQPCSFATPCHISPRGATFPIHTKERCRAVPCHTSPRAESPSAFSTRVSTAFHLTLIHGLLEDGYDRRIEFCENWLQKLDDQPELEDSVLWSDESTIHLDGHICDLMTQLMEAQRKLARNGRGAIRNQKFLDRHEKFI